MVSVIALDRSLELRHSVDEGTTVQVMVAVDENGDLIVSGHDSGKAPAKLLGSRTFDHWVLVADEDKDVVLLQLLRERFGDISAPSAEFMEWLKTHDIPHQVGSEAGAHRGVYRPFTSPRRRGTTRRPKRTRAGP